MDGIKFDDLIRSTVTSRRPVLRGLALGSVSAVLARLIALEESLARKSNGNRGDHDLRRQRKRRDRARTAAPDRGRPSPATVICGGHPLTPGMQLTRCDLADRDLRRLALHSAAIGRTDFSRANLCGADLQSSSFLGTSFRGANLTAADLRSSSHSQTDFSGADLTRANFHGATFKDADFDRAIFCETIMPDGRLRNSGCDECRNTCGCRDCGSGHCEPFYCCQGECVDHLHNRCDCGNTGRSCRQDEVCLRDECCRSDRVFVDCPPDYLCVRDGKTWCCADDGLVPSVCCDADKTCGDACCDAYHDCVNGQCTCKAAHRCRDWCCGANQRCIDTPAPGITAADGGAGGGVGPGPGITGCECREEYRCGNACCSPGEVCHTGACVSPEQVCGNRFCLPRYECRQGQCECPRPCGDDCCAEDAVCLDLGFARRCCPATRACGQRCCDPRDRCIDGQCRGCAQERRCGDVCCSSGETCNPVSGRCDGSGTGGGGGAGFARVRRFVAR